MEERVYSFFSFFSHRFAFFLPICSRSLALSIPPPFPISIKHRRRRRPRRLRHRPRLVPRAAEADPRADGGHEGKEFRSVPDDEGGRVSTRETATTIKEKKKLDPHPSSRPSGGKKTLSPQSIPVPLSGDPAAVKKFAADVEALKRRAGVPDEAELEAALVSFRLKSSGGDLRKALAGLTPDDADLDSALTALLEQAERESGGALTDANAKGWSLLASKVQALAKSKGLEDVAKVKAEATVKMYADALASLREGAADAVSAAARRDGLEGVVSVDAAALKPKW